MDDKYEKPKDRNNKIIIKNRPSKTKIKIKKKKKVKMLFRLQ